MCKEKKQTKINEIDNLPLVSGNGVERMRGRNAIQQITFHRSETF